MRFTLTDLADALGARLGGDSATAGGIVVDGLSIDSRTAAPQGTCSYPSLPNATGTTFIAAAARPAGVSAWLTEPGRPEADETGALIVDDTATALLRIGAIARDRLPDTVVGVTGSSGKTSTKDLLASVLRVRGEATANEKSFNNELGVPPHARECRSSLLGGRDRDGCPGQGPHRPALLDRASDRRRDHQHRHGTP